MENALKVCQVWQALGIIVEYLPKGVKPQKGRYGKPSE